MYGLRNQRVPGMQVHAVPEAERAIDSSGRRLPWAYDYSGPDSGERPPVEKGPFGRSMRRTRSGLSRSRSKTAEPRREEDKIKAENMAAEDAVFGSLRRVGTKEDAGKRDALGEVDPNAAGAQSSTRLSTADTADSEPTEVLLYGFGEDLQWSAIDFYERVSNGYILEDYDRQPPGQRYDVSRTMGRAQAQRSLSRAAMRKKNKFAGGEHWIKVTFESRQAAELAIARQPHTIRGYLVYAEPYQGRGPQKDEAVLTTQAGAQITSEQLPKTFSTTAGVVEGSPNGSSTVSSATATAPTTAGQPLRSPLGGAQDSPTASSSTLNNGLAARPAAATPAQQQATGFQAAPASVAQPRRLRIDGAIPAKVLPAELALAPKQPKASWTSWIGASEIIGSAVPRKEDGTFDWDRASLYWRLFAWLDWVLGTDLCGLKTDD
ncbi:hypothetical protein M409DRAFT_62971 [Zasmidium cellare ATCC 36951]|uniref:Nucleoporin NUP53 n=1 Tax=Zasmidium cellare ATCC 36951 TaxID=1080233 RepID=A0A6A6D3H7_ZASCE|nr:uncharacterized protein M409DRAFT_62971 [Zasmidium cellare ATCC 36951]KAF2172216.1 hypothetical protein M409DRAFT_62971 [Zasmidium cellare ATCC 36951]